MLSWKEVLFMIAIGIICGVGEIVLLETLLSYKVVQNWIKNYCNNPNRIIRAPKNKCFYKIWFYLTSGEKISRAFISPNMISLGRTIGCVIVVPLAAKLSPNLAIYLFIISALADTIDGEVARRCGLVTEFGKKFDPLCDKLCYLFPMFLFCGNLKWVWFLLLSEVWGQFAIRPILPRLGLEKNVAANRIGKLKAVLCFALIPYSFLVNIGAPIPNWKEEVLITCFVLSMLSWGFKLIKEDWYANFFTGINLLCGIVAFRFAGYNNAYVLLLILVGQCSDAVDGYVAKIYGGTPPWGELFDDLADLVSFGVVPAKMIILILEKTIPSYFIGGTYFLAVFFRLVRFLLVDKNIPTEKKLNWLEIFSLSSRKFIAEKMREFSWLEKFSFLFFDRQGKERAENIFAGLPSPAATTVVLGAALLFPEWLLWITIIATIGLAISRLHFAHFSREILPQMPKLTIATLALILLAVVVYTLINGRHFTIALLSVIYGCAYLLYNLKNMYN